MNIIEITHTIATLEEQKDQIVKKLKELKETKEELVMKEKYDNARKLINNITYKDSIFTYNGTTAVIHKERIESINIYEGKSWVKNVYIPTPTVVIAYQPKGTSRVAKVSVDCYNQLQVDMAYDKLRTLLLDAK